MTVDIVTIFPAMIEQPLAAGILGRAIERGTLDVKVRDLRNCTTARHRVVADGPYAGGPGGMRKNGVGKGPAPVAFEGLMVATLPPPLPDGTMELLIGRSPDAELVIEDASVSSRHAAIRWDGEQAVIVDLGSANGTRVRDRQLDHGRPAGSGPLQHGLAQRDVLDAGAGADPLALEVRHGLDQSVLGHD